MQSIKPRFQWEPCNCIQGLCVCHFPSIWDADYRLRWVTRVRVGFRGAHVWSCQGTECRTSFFLYLILMWTESRGLLWLCWLRDCRTMGIHSFSLCVQQRWWKPLQALPHSWKCCLLTLSQSDAAMSSKKCKVWRCGRGDWGTEYFMELLHLKSNIHIQLVATVPDHNDPGTSVPWSLVSLSYTFTGFYKPLISPVHTCFQCVQETWPYGPKLLVHMPSLS